MTYASIITVFGRRRHNTLPVMELLTAKPIIYVYGLEYRYGGSMVVPADSFMTDNKPGLYWRRHGQRRTTGIRLDADFCAKWLHINVHRIVNAYTQRDGQRAEIGLRGIFKLKTVSIDSS